MALKKVSLSFCGWQEWPGRAALALWNVREAAPGLARGTTVSAETLARRGFYAPDARRFAPGEVFQG